MAIPPNYIDRARREDEAHARCVALRREKREREIELARLARTIDRSCAFVYFACASFAEYGTRFGYSPEEARAFAAVGEALEVAPELSERLLDGRLTFDAVAALARLLVHPAFAGQRAEWVALAESTELAELKRRVRKALAEAERKEMVVPKTVFLTEQDDRDFLDARALACRKEGRTLSEGETVGYLSRYYLSREDPLRRPAQKRRLPHTSAVDSREIPAEVRRQVWGRTRGRCAVWGCRNRRGVQYAHLHPHAEGGDREAENLILLCPGHHLLYDADLMRIEGTAEHPVFKDRDGNLFPFGPGPPDSG